MALRLLRVGAAGALLALSAGAGSPPGERTVEVTIHHSRFVPAEIEVAPGTTVTFVVRNADPIDHEFIVGDRGVQDRHEGGTELRHGERPGELSLAAGGVAQTTYAFPEAGRVLIGCHLPGHWGYGMRGSVLVA